MIRDVLSLDAAYRQIRVDLITGKISAVDFVVEPNPRLQPSLLTPQKKSATKPATRKNSQ